MKTKNMRELEKMWAKKGLEHSIAAERSYA